MSKEEKEYDGEVNPLDNMMSQLRNAREHINITDDVFERIRFPDRVAEFNIPVRMDDGSVESFTAYRCQHDDARGPYKGGIRYHPNVSRDEVTALAGLDVLEDRGRRSAFRRGERRRRLDPKEMSDREVEGLTRRYTKAMRSLIGPEKDIPAPDVNTGPQTMAWIMDTYSIHHDYTIPGVVTGKPVELGGSEGRSTATGTGVSMLADCVADYYDTPLPNATVAVQGFGNAGSVAARLLDEKGADVVAVSDSAGGIYDPEGLDIAGVESHKEKTGQVTNFRDANGITNEELLKLDVDILVPAALENAIDASIADEVEADTVLEAANGPTTDKANGILVERGVRIFPDILANAGGVIVSYLEWVQNTQRYSWDQENVHGKLKDRMSDSFGEVMEAHESIDTDCIRTAAYTVALERVAESHEMRGLYP